MSRRSELNILVCFWRFKFPHSIKLSNCCQFSPYADLRSHSDSNKHCWKSYPKSKDSSISTYYHHGNQQCGVSSSPKHRISSGRSACHLSAGVRNVNWRVSRKKISCLALLIRAISGKTFQPCDKYAHISIRRLWNSSLFLSDYVW